MYNSIHPINITYKNYAKTYGTQNQDANGQAQQPPVSYDQGSRGSNREFPNGTKVAIDYTKNTVNISQIITDFKSTVIAIGAPDDISDEVNSYLSLVEKESKKANPSREIILSNLMNASKISDNYIYQELSKKNSNAPKNVVQGWIDALFKQKIELKADPTHINPDFQLEIPDKKKPEQQEQTTSVANEFQHTATEFAGQDEQQVQRHSNIQPFARQIPAEDMYEPAQVQNEHLQTQNESATDVTDVEKYTPEPQPIMQSQSEDVSDVIEFKTVDVNQSAPVQVIDTQAELIQPVQSDVVEVGSVQTAQIQAVPVAETQVAQITSSKQLSNKVKYVTSEHDRVLSNSLKDAKVYLTLDDDPALALETLNDALGEVTEETNPNLRAALHFERGKIFDEYDYANYALRDFYEATKCEDDNLKSQAHLKMARIYDDYVEFEPAVEHYQDALGYSGEASNLRAQTRILSEMSDMFAQRYDFESTQMLSNLAIEAAGDTNDPILLAKTYTNAGRNYEYLGEDFAALDSYKHAVKAIDAMPDDGDMLEMRAQSYEDAADVMDRLGNAAKAENLLAKARLYRQRAQLEQMSAAG